MDPYNKIIQLMSRKSTSIWGLDFEPSLEPHVPNTQDNPVYGWISTQEFTDENMQIVKNVLDELSKNCKTIVEIGVNHNRERSISLMLVSSIHKKFYLGIDLDDKSYLDDESSGTYTLKCNSHDQQTIRDFLKSKNIYSIDLLFIDGDHSVTSCINDWKYADMLSEHGIVILHDTNSHPGCVCLFEAVNSNLFDKQRYCLENDFGIALFRKK